MWGGSTGVFEMPEGLLGRTLSLTSVIGNWKLERARIVGVFILKNYP